MQGAPAFQPCQYSLDLIQNCKYSHKRHLVSQSKLKLAHQFICHYESGFIWNVLLLMIQALISSSKQSSTIIFTSSLHLYNRSLYWSLCYTVLFYTGLCFIPFYFILVSVLYWFILYCFILYWFILY